MQHHIEYEAVLAVIRLTRLHRRADGFTLIELMVTIAIGAILLSIAAPSFTQFQRNSALTSAANSFVGSLSAARGEAMKRALPVMASPVSGANLANGWLVFVDVNKDGQYSAAQDILLSQQDALPSYLSVSISGPSYLLFDGSGYSKSTASAFQSNTLSIARTDVVSTSETRRVVIAVTGRIRACKPASDSTCTTNATE